MRRAAPGGGQAYPEDTVRPGKEGLEWAGVGRMSQLRRVGERRGESPVDTSRLGDIEDPWAEVCSAGQDLRAWGCGEGRRRCTE